MSAVREKSGGPRRIDAARVFWGAWLRHPRRVGAVTPSGRSLAELITREIDAACAPILELGPGTGVFTRCLLARGIPESQISLVECDARFARCLTRQFPQALVLNFNAARLRKLNLLDGRLAGAAVSGLPLLALSRREVFSILDGTFEHLRPHAALYQFTYGLRCPVPRPVLERLGLKVTLIGRALVNVPPARVYRIRRRRVRA